MRAMEFLTFCFTGIFIIILLTAFAGNIIGKIRGMRKLKRNDFVKRARKELQERYPFLNAEKFTPIIALPSPCCKTMMWIYWNMVSHYFCGQCGKKYHQEYDFYKKRCTGKLIPSHDRDLSALNELFKQWAEETAKIPKSRP